VPVLDVTILSIVFTISLVMISFNSSEVNGGALFSGI
tara:strand:- start:8 stop:118 length:111 start_codon:yes stop_codon:yes gene_type:complete